MPNRSELIGEWERYRTYYEKRRLETGTPSVFEVLWAGHVMASKQLSGEEPDPKIVDWMNKPDLQTHYTVERVWHRIVEEVRTCHSCKLHGSRINPVPGGGNLRAEVVFVGEAPGQDEDESGQPFVGRAGQWMFDKFVPAATGLQRKDVAIINVLKCRPPNNRDPEADEIHACYGFLTRQIAAINPKVLVAMGKVAARVLTRERVNTLGEVLRRMHWYEHIPLIITPHPAANTRDHSRWDHVTSEALQWVNWIRDQKFDSDFWNRK